MSEHQERHNKPDQPSEDEGAPRQALSGGGSETRAGSPSGGSAPGDEPDEPEEPEGGFRASPEAADAGRVDGETPSFTSPDGAEDGSGDLVNNTGEPRQMKNRADIERAAGDDVDAATG